jgi:16S rRNA (guanine1516-N2)-methyltransferase
LSYSNAQSAPVNLALLAATAADESRAAALAQRLDLPILATGSDPVCCDGDAVLVVAASALTLQQTGAGASGPVGVDFGSAGMRHRRRSGANELLGRAVGWGKKSPLTILDGTAGLGRDAFVLADLGCQVVLCEREPLIIELLRAGMQVAADCGDPWLAGVSHRMRLRVGDVRNMAAVDLQGVDVIYLDPMFPPRAKSAAVKKEMALFQMLLDSSSDFLEADSLLEWAIALETSRVVVKRPAKAPNLAGLQPSHRIAGSAVRYDVYVHRKLS